MKKILLVLVMVMALGLGANAQRDGFFNDWDDYSNGLDRTELDMPALPTHGLDQNQNAPLGSGLLVLTALGAGYAMLKKRD